MKRVLVSKTDITKATLAEGPDPALQDGQARLALDSFALTTNNITYAATGDVLKYWQFFPSGADGQGIVPVWGVAEVTDSRGDLPVGTRLYGFHPMAAGQVITPKQVAPGVWVDTAAHRKGLALVYNTYTEVKGGDARQDHLRALLQPLLATSYLLFDWLLDNDWFGAEQIIVGSASSKTGLGLCKYLAEPEGRPYRIVGLTSAGNKAFVQELGACDQVLTYEEIETLAEVPSVYVDMAGNAEVKARLHAHLDQALRHSSAVGTSHWDKFAPPVDLKGPKPQFFFAPSQVAKRQQDWGPGVIEGRITAAWKRIAEEAGDWLDVVEHEGLDTAVTVWGRLAGGEVNPREGHVVRV